MDTSDRYHQPEGISKRHLIFTYQQQPCPTGKHVSPSQTPPFNCFELSIQHCLSPLQSLRVPLPHACIQAPKCYVQQWSTMPRWLRVTSLLTSQWWQGTWDSLASFLPGAVVSTVLGCGQVRPRQIHLPSLWRRTALSALCVMWVIQGPPRHLPSTTAWDHRDRRACTALPHARKEGRFGPSESIFFL